VIVTITTAGQHLLLENIDLSFLAEEAKVTFAEGITPQASKLVQLDGMCISKSNTEFCKTLKSYSLYSRHIK